MQEETASEATDRMEIRLGPFVLGPCGLEIEGVPDIDDWESILKVLLWMARNHPWWIGDLITFGEARFGEEFYSAIEPDPATVDMISRHAGVARAIKPSERRPGLSWSHHRNVVSLKPAVRQEVLEYAEENCIASGKMNDVVKAFRRHGAGGS